MRRKRLHRAEWGSDEISQSVQSFSCVRLFATPGTAARSPVHHLSCPSPTPEACSNSCQSSWWCHPTHLILCCPLLLLPSIFLSIRLFSNESVLAWMVPGNLHLGQFPRDSWEHICLRLTYFMEMEPRRGQLPINRASSTSDYFKPNSNSNNYKSDTILGSGAMHACLVTQSYPTLCDPMNYSQPGSSAHGIFSRQEYWNG